MPIPIDPVAVIALLNIADQIYREATRKPEPKTTPEEAELLRALTEMQVAGAQYILRNPPQKAS
jgi:hypothetical protein